MILSQLLISTGCLLIAFSHALEDSSAQLATPKDLKKRYTLSCEAIAKYPVKCHTIKFDSGSCKGCTMTGLGMGSCNEPYHCASCSTALKYCESSPGCSFDEAEFLGCVDNLGSGSENSSSSKLTSSISSSRPTGVPVGLSTSTISSAVTTATAKQNGADRLVSENGLARLLALVLSIVLAP